MMSARLEFDCSNFGFQFYYHLCRCPAFISNLVLTIIDQPFPLFITAILTPLHTHTHTHGSPYRHSTHFTPAFFVWYLNNILSFTRFLWPLLYIGEKCR